MYRLTLVKEWNTEELESYADLVKRGNPDFIEVKVSTSLQCRCSTMCLLPPLLVFFLSSGALSLAFYCSPPQGVTYCGDSKASNITMANIPWHEEVNS